MGGLGYTLVARLADGMDVGGEKKKRFKGLGLEQLAGW